jgi:hypothetical protein
LTEKTRLYHNPKRDEIIAEKRAANDKLAREILEVKMSNCKISNWKDDDELQNATKADDKETETYVTPGK